MKKYFLITVALLAGIVLFGHDPLEKIDAYSVEVTPELRGTKNFFPIGILGERAFDELPLMGLNITENIYTPYDFREGLPSRLTRNSSDKGTYFYCLWVAHSVRGRLQTKNHGLLKSSIKSDGKPQGGSHINYFDPGTRKYMMEAAAFAVKSVLEKDTSNITLWGIDNEWEPGMDYSPEATAAFRDNLEKEYGGDLVRLNKAWESDYRSFSDAVPPKIEERNDRPGAWLDWRRFQDREYADFVVDYFTAIRDADPEKRPVISKATQCTLEMQAVARNRAVDHEIAADKLRDLGQGWYGIDQYGHGDRNNYELNYLYNCIRPVDPADAKYRYGLFSAETNNHAGPGWQFAQTFWRCLANGFKGVDFFVMGSFLGEGDYATFGMTYPDNSRRDRFYYTSRLASLIHRAEAFMAQSAPAEGLPRIAMLMPKRDILLAADTGVSWWDYSSNSRLNVYRRLRDTGYWVDVLPYNKLIPAWLDRYDALLLVDADHLTAGECKEIAAYVEKGGVLLADMRAGHYNEHHEVIEGLAGVLGVKYKGVYSGIEVSPDDLWYMTEYGNVIRADGKINVKLVTGKLENKLDVFRNFKGGWIVRNHYGKGKALYFNTRLGALRPESADDMVVARWMADRLQSVGVKPGYSGNELFRVETPVADREGNVGVVIAGSTYRPVPAGTLSVTLPAGREYGSAFWASAESTRLEKVKFEVKDGIGRFEMPEIASAGMLYLFRSGPPLLGQYADGVTEHPEFDRHTAQIRPGKSFTVKVQIANPAAEPLKNGILKLDALGGWKVNGPSGWFGLVKNDRNEIEVGSIAPGEIKEFAFEVTAPEESGFYRPNRVYPLVSSYWVDGRRIAVNNMIVTVDIDLSEIEVLLSDNGGWGGNTFRPFARRTCATYRYLSDPAAVKDPRNSKEPGHYGNALAFRGQAAFLSKSAEVEFDLKNTYELSRIVLTNAGKTMPEKIIVKVDGKTVVEVTEPEWDGKKLELKLDSIPGQKVAVVFGFPTEKGGVFDEIEIYGYPVK